MKKSLNWWGYCSIFEFHFFNTVQALHLVLKKKSRSSKGSASRAASRASLNQCWPKDIRYSLSSDIRIKMVVIFILSFFYSEWSNNHLIFILSFHFLGIILFEKIRITSNNHSFFKMGKNVISWLLFPSNFGRESLVWQLFGAITDKCSH